MWLPPLFPFSISRTFSSSQTETPYPLTSNSSSPRPSLQPLEVLYFLFKPYFMYLLDRKKGDLPLTHRWIGSEDQTPAWERTHDTGLLDPDPVFLLVFLFPAPLLRKLGPWYCPGPGLECSTQTHIPSPLGHSPRPLKFPFPSTEDKDEITHSTAWRAYWAKHTKHPGCLRFEENIYEHKAKCCTLRTQTRAWESVWSCSNHAKTNHFHVDSFGVLFPRAIL